MSQSRLFARAKFGKSVEIDTPQPIVSINLWHDHEQNTACLQFTTIDETRLIYANYAGVIKKIIKADEERLAFMQVVDSPSFSIEYYSESRPGLIKDNLKRFFEPSDLENEKLRKYFSHFKDDLKALTWALLNEGKETQAFISWGQLQKYLEVKKSSTDFEFNEVPKERRCIMM